MGIAQTELPIAGWALLNVCQRLQKRLAPVFQGFLHFMEELMSDSAVDYPVIVAERDVAHRADGDGVVDNYRPFFDHAEPEDAVVWLADDRQAEKTAKCTRVGDGESAFLHFFR